MKFLVTGNNGFKGTWLSIYLAALGHEVHGYSLDYHPEGLSYKADPRHWLATQRIADIRAKDDLRRAFQAVRPDLVIHLAAQPIVLDSIADPIGTFDVNVSGTINLIEEAAFVGTVSRVLIVTSDKVYGQRASSAPFTELDPLGGRDPYSSSKVCQDQIAQSFQSYGKGPEILIARAGNVLGGYDRGNHRLMREIVESISSGTRLSVRQPHSTRPWQHVLDCTSGYIKYVLADEPPSILNFGPNLNEQITVKNLLDKVIEQGFQLDYNLAPHQDFAEAEELRLDSTLASQELNWHPIYDVDDAVSHSLMELGDGDDWREAMNSVSKHLSKAF